MLSSRPGDGVRGAQGKCRVTRFIIVGVMLVFISLVSLYATVFQHREINGLLQVYAPLVWFEDPRVPGVTVSLAKSNTSANISINATPEIVLARRSALYYDTFDTNPIGTRLVAYTCTWTYNSTRGSVNITAGARSNLTWGFWCVIVVNPAILNISSYVLEGRAIYVSFATFRSSFNVPTNNSMSAIYLNSTTPVFYHVGFNITPLTARTGDLHGSLIGLRTPTANITLAHAPLGTLLLLEYDYLYHVSTSMNYTAWTASHFVNTTYTHSTSIAPANRYIPYAVGVGYWVNRTDVTGWFAFDSLIVTVDHPSWYVNVTGLPDGWRVVLRNSTRGIVANVSSIGGLATLYVAPNLTDLVGFTYNLSTDPGFIFRNATIEIYDATGRLVHNRTFDVVLGGDLYYFRYFFNGTILSIYSNLTRGFQSRLEHAQTTAYICGVGFNASIGLVNRTLATTNPNITIINGLVVEYSTGVIRADPPVNWTNKWLAANITATITFPYNMTHCYLTLRYKWWISEAAIAVYTVRINITRP